MRLSAILLALCLVLGCSDDSPCPSTNVTLYCDSCDGTGGRMALSTQTPVPVAVIMTHDLCFTPQSDELCWYGCPGTIEESVSRGLELCTEEVAHGN